ncbi:MAG TPA: Ig-like domain-containing protein [Gemmatimonadales bacterium]|nr:Ig-like domain-containing protein [Gemmatimonadales bacterium]
MTFTFKLAKRLSHSRFVSTRLLAAAVLLAGCADAAGVGPTSSTLDTVSAAPRVASVTVTPGTAAGTVGQSAQFSAVARDANGRTYSGLAVTWSSSNTAVVTVTSTGIATAIGGGSATVNATISGVTGRATVTVTGATITVANVAVTPGSASGNIGDAAQFTAAVTDGAGAPITSVPVTWSTSNAAVITVSSTGYVTAVGGGSADVIATAGAKSGKATVTVAGAPATTVGSVTVTPGSASGSAGQSAQFDAIVKDANGVELTGQSITWTSTDPAVVSVTSSGYATAVGGGNAAIVATVGGKSGQAAITVSGGSTTPAPVASISLAPATISVGIGGIQAITPTLKDASGNVLSGRTISWTTSAPLIGSVNTLGVVTGLVAGTTTITATSEGKSANATVTVTASAPPPPPPPSGGTWAHEPSGYPLVSDNAFDALTGNGWDIAWNDRGLGVIVQDNTAPMSASNVLQMTYPIGYTGGEGPANVWRPLNNLRRMYTGFMFKVSNPWQGHPSNVNKILFAFPSSGGDIYLTMYGPPGGPYELRVLPQYPGITSDWLRPNVNNPQVTLGTWHKIEWNIDYSAGGANGIVQWWMDGVLIGDYRNTQVPAGGFTEFKINPTWGGLGDTKQTNDYFRYDQIRISGN